MFEQLITEKFLADLAKKLKARFTPEQTQVIKLLAFEADQNGIKDQNMFAYILGTCWHECRFRSIPEIRAKPGTQVWKWQNVYWPSGYYGRGLPQLTWRKNYKKFSPVVGIDLVKNPDAVLKPEVGAKILVFGMYNGSFTSLTLTSTNGLPKYFPPGGTPNWIKARGIINGTFQAEIVAAGAIKILSVIVANRKDIS